MTPFGCSPRASQAQGLAGEAPPAQPGPLGVADSPFFRLGARPTPLLSASGGDPTAVGRRWSEEARLPGGAGRIERRLEIEGVSVDIVYGLEVIERCLLRMERMVGTLAAAPGSAPRFHDLLAALVRRSHQDRSVAHLLGWNLRLLARKIVERSGAHRRALHRATRAEYRHIWLAAAGGGAAHRGSPPRSSWRSTTCPRPTSPDGVLYGLNYAVSFLRSRRSG